MLNINEVINYLGVDRSRIEELIRKKKLRAYRIGGTYIRFRKEEVEGLIPHVRRTQQLGPLSIFDRVRDFWRYYNFYILSFVFVALLLFALVHG
ncbi:MAG: helix-turn-helix domain-containing protein [Candidatus Omnitrophica bacterium]|nr:helix-turn-helix domain-containing protein [Candidatus Omnitrophota bacterium]